jgi:hypothetical protein
LLLLAVISFQYVSLHRLAAASGPIVGHRSSSTAATAVDSTSPNLGFPYPQLAKARQLVTSLCCNPEQHFSWAELTAAYGAALDVLEQGSELRSSRVGHGSRTDTTTTTSSSSLLQELLAEASTLLAAEPGLLRCSRDETLLAAWRAAATASTKANTSHGATAADVTTTAAAAHAAAVSQQPLQSRRYLLAANFHNNAAVLPNFVAQALRLALLMPQGHFAVSLYESGSSDTTRLWLTLLHQLLLPLRVPHNITVGGVLSPRLGLPRIQLLAALRNALLDPWLLQQQPQQDKEQGLQQHNSDNQQAQQHAGWRFRRTSRAAAAQKRSAAAAGGAASSLSYGVGSGFVPDTLVFANDVLLCAGDVLRLIMHDAHISCGMDFYTAPWQQQQQQQQQGTGDSTRGTTDATASSSKSSSDVIDDEDDDFFDPDSMQLLSSTASSTGGKASNMQQQQQRHGSGSGSLRFYDKVRAKGCSAVGLLA